MRAQLGWLAGAVVIAAAVLVGCGGRSPGTSPGGGSTPGATLTAPPLATLAPFDVTETAIPVPVPASTAAGAAPFAVAIVSAQQVITEVDLDAGGAEIEPGTTVDEEVTDATPSNAPAPTAHERGASAARFPATVDRTHIETVSLTFSQTVSLAQRPTFVLTFATGYLVPANYYLELYDTSEQSLGWQDPFEGPATINETILLFNDTGNPFTFLAGIEYLFHLYAVSVFSSPTPFPAIPTPVGQTPSPAPSRSPGPFIVNPSSIGFIASGESVVLTVTEVGSGGSFTATVANPSLATITQTSGTTFTVTSTANPGASQITIEDERGETVNVPITVTITEGTISAVHRR